MSKKSMFWLAALALTSGLYGCEDSSSSITGYVLKCPPGEIKCEDGTLSTCLGVKWEGIPCPTGACADAASCKLDAGQVCIPGQSKCSADGSVILTCSSDGSKFEESPCADGKCNMSAGKIECSSEDEILECNEGDVKCSGDNSGTVACTDKQKWGATVKCPGGEICDPAQKKCVEDHTEHKCVEGATECDGTNKIKTCQADGTWVTSDCVEPTPVCNFATRQCVESGEACTDGDIECDGIDKLRVCEDGSWVTSACTDPTPVCDPELKQCIAQEGPCEPGTVECVGADKIRTCQDDGTWVTNDCADPTPICNSAAKECVAAVTELCEEGATECDSTNEIKTCLEDGKWVISECPADTPICDIATGKCVSPVSYECLSKADCPVDEDCSLETHTCVPVGPVVAKMCNNDFSAIINADTSETIEDCAAKKLVCDPASVTCVEPGAACKEGSKVCFDKTSYQVCNGHGWGIPVECPVDQFCDFDKNTCVSITPSCTPDDNRCKDSSHIFECDPKTGNLIQKACPSDKPVCSFKLNQCIVDTPTECEPGSYDCFNEKTARKCNEYGRWTYSSCLVGQICEPGYGYCIDISTPDECKDGDHYCFVDDSGFNGFKYCKDNRWEIQYCVEGYVCNDEKLGCVPGASFECKEGEMRCNAAFSEVQVCKERKWVTAEYCKEPTRCDPSTNTCSGGSEYCDGKRYCLDDYTATYCKGSEWFVDYCKTEDGTGICMDGYCKSVSVECKDGDRRCSADYSGYQLCKDGKWYSRDCDKGLVCDPLTVRCAEKPIECKDGERLCTDSSSYQYCKGGTWYYYSCALGTYCNKDSGMCETPATECKYGEKYCNGDELVYCTKDGHWEKQMCGESQYCDAKLGQCVSIFSDCKEGDQYCNSTSSLMICVKGKWVVSECSEDQYCDEKLNACVGYYSCDEGNFYCADSNTLMYCKGGKWSTEFCGKSQYCDEKSGKCVDYPTTCTPGEVKCYDDFNLMICSKDGSWYMSPCSGETPFCSSGLSRCTECMPGDRTCSGDLLLECNRSGKWAKSECEDGMVCMDGKCVDAGYECKDGDTYCKDYGTSMYCKGGKWNTIICNKSQYCDKDKGVCTDVVYCEDGAKRCSESNSAVEICKGNAWTTYDFCSKSEVCMDGECVPWTTECKDGETRCEGSMGVTYCKDGYWSYTEVCKSGYYCDEKVNACVPSSIDECKEGDAYCSDEMTVKVCVKGVWTSTICEKGSYCADGLCVSSVFECKDGARKCDGNYAMVCEGGKWSAEFCGKYKTCENGYCVEACKDGAYKCNEASNAVMYCKGGTWITDTICSKYQYCADGKCVDSPVIECKDGDQYCFDDATGYRYCEKGIWKDVLCTVSQYCDSSTNTCVDISCKDGDKYCKDDYTAMYCKGGKWATTDCAKSQICLKGECVNSSEYCKDGDAYCKDDYTAMSCVKGAWMSTTCGKSQICKEGKCVSSLYCKDESDYCADDYTVMSCVEGKWLSKVCGKSQICLTGKCVSSDIYCTESSIPYCSDKMTLMTCIKNMWQASTCKKGCMDGACI